jgi:hypothetical protein
MSLVGTYGTFATSVSTLPLSADGSAAKRSPWYTFPP